MRQPLFILLLIPFLSYGQTKDSTTHFKLFKHKPIGFVELDYIGESWQFRNRNNNSYGSLRYSGYGWYGGVGFRSIPNKRNLSWGAIMGAETFTINNKIKENLNLPTTYQFSKWTLMGNYHIHLNGWSAYLSGQAAYLYAMSSNTQSYLQLGVKCIAEFDAFGVSVGYRFTPGSNGPVSFPEKTWRGTTMSVGAVLYPGRLELWNSVRTAFK